MGGGGFMQHASDTNRKDRAQREARRQKFNENRSEVITVDSESTIKVDFSNLSEEQIAQERERIHQLFVKRRKRQVILLISALIGLVLGISVLYSIVDVSN